MQELERRGNNIRAAERDKFMPKDISLFTGKRRKAILESMVLPGACPRV